MVPDKSGLSGRKALQEALGDKADLDVPVVGGKLAADGGSIVLGLMMEELVAGATADGFHLHHPEVIGPGADGVKGVLEGEFDFEAQGIEADDLGGRQRKVGGHEDQAAAGGMDDGDETHEAAGGAPEQIA